jgi:hypothetical protein
MFFGFPEGACWSRDTQSVEFGVAIGEYEGVVRVLRQVFWRRHARTLPGSLPSTTKRVSSLPPNESCAGGS